MATSPPLSPYFLAEKSSLIASWITGLPRSAPVDTNLEHIRPPKREHASMATAPREPSPEKRRRVDEVVTPGQSASLTSSSHPLDLGQHNTFSLPSSHVGSRRSRAGTGASSPRRGISPLRETIATLKDASPPIQTEPYDGAQLPANEAIREKVMATMEQLEPGQVDGWVPRCLKVCAYMR
jgi:hypothetical protein